MSTFSAHRSKGKPGPAGLALSWLDGDQQGANVLATARMMLAIEQATARVLPPALAQVCKVARIERQQITLAVPSPAYASKLRQLAPRIIRLLNEGGWNLNEIIVRVQAGLLQTETKPALRESLPLGTAGLAAFSALQENVAPGPLADAIAQLLVRHKD